MPSFKVSSISLTPKFLETAMIFISSGFLFTLMHFSAILLRKDLILSAIISNLESECMLFRTKNQRNREYILERMEGAFKKFKDKPIPYTHLGKWLYCTKGEGWNNGI